MAQSVDVFKRIGALDEKDLIVKTHRNRTNYSIQSTKSSKNKWGGQHTKKTNTKDRSQKNYINDV